MTAPMRCPVCRAPVEQGPQCRRCRADLSVLFTLEDQRRRTLRAGYGWLARGEFGRALDLADAAEQMRAGEDARRLRALCHLMHGDHSRALAAALGLVLQDQGGPCSSF